MWTIWFISGKNLRIWIKYQVTETYSVLNNDQLLSKNHGNLILPDTSWLSYCNSKFLKSADIQRHKQFSWTLHSSNFVRMHWIIIVLLPFLISIGWTTGWCKLIFDWAPSIFTQFVPHGFTCPVVLILTGLYFGSYQDLVYAICVFWLQLCDIVCIWYNDNFLTTGAVKFKSKQFSEFGSQTVT